MFLVRRSISMVFNRNKQFVPARHCADWIPVELGIIIQNLTPKILYLHRCAKQSVQETFFGKACDPIMWRKHIDVFT